MSEKKVRQKFSPIENWAPGSALSNIEFSHWSCSAVGATVNHPLIDNSGENGCLMKFINNSAVFSYERIAEKW